MEYEETPEQIAFAKKLEEYLLGHDWTGASELILAHKGRKRNHAMVIPHPLYGKLSALEAAIIFDHVRLYDAIWCLFPYSNGFTAENNHGFSPGYLAILHNTSFKEKVLRNDGVFKVKNQFLAHLVPFLPQSYEKLSLACMFGHIHVAEFVLRENPAELDKETAPCSRMPIEIAALYNHYDMCKLLLSYKLKKSTLAHQCDLGNALHIAARFGFDKVVKVLVAESGMNTYKSVIEEREVHSEMTALGLAVNFLHSDAVKELLEAGAKVNAEQGVKKLTPLQLVLSRDCQLREEFVSKDKFVRDKIVLLLLNLGAATDLLTAEQLAYMYGNLKQRQQAKAQLVQEVHDEVKIIDEEPEELLLPDTEDITLSSSPSKNTPPKRKAVKCHLCNKKFTSEVSLQAHLKSKGHLKQIRKQNELKTTPEALEQKQKELKGLAEHLPVPIFADLFFEVFNRLEVIDLRQLSATCKSMKLLVDKHGVCWRRLVLWPSTKNRQRVANGTSNVFEDVMRHLPKAKEIIYVRTNSHCADLYSSLFAIPRECRQLESLDLRNETTNRLPISFLNHLFENCPNLKVLKMNSIWPYKPSKISAVMNGELDIEQQLVVNPKKPWKVKKTPTGPKVADWLVDFNTNMPAAAHKLEHLEMTLKFNEPKITPEQYMEFYFGLFKHWPNVKHLKLYIGSEHDTDVGPTVATPQLYRHIVIGALEICPKITKLQLDGFFQLGRLSNNEYDQLFRRFGQLKKLNLRGQELNNFDRDMLHYLADYCTKLTALKIESLEGLHMILGQEYPFARMTQLRQFHLINADLELGHPCLYDMIRSCRNITNLKLSVRPTSDELIRTIALYGTQLQSLMLSYNHEIDYSPLSACTNLTSLNLNGITADKLHNITDKCRKLRELIFECYVPEELGWGFVDDEPEVAHVFNMGRLLECCTNLTKLLIYRALFTEKSFNNPVVSTSLRMIEGMSSTKDFHSDLPLFYLSECCPNLTYLRTSTHFFMTNAAEHILTTRFPKLESFGSYDQAQLTLMLERVNANRLLKFRTEFFFS